MKKQNNQKNFISIISIILSTLFLLAGCGSSGVGGDTSSSESSVTTNVVINLGSGGSGAGGASYAAAAASIPSSINAIKCVVSGPGMGIMEKTVLVNGSDTVVIELFVPNGTARHFEIFAYDISGTLIYYGDTYKDLNGVPVNGLTIIMAHAAVDFGSLSGMVTDSQTGDPVLGALITIYLGGSEADSATSDESGNYIINDLTPGDYRLVVSATGFFDNIIEGVQVNPSENTVKNIILSRVIVVDGLRMVLTWGESPSDLDSHLWLPSENPYHIYYSDKGNKLDFPSASLDLDDTDSFGPETITIWNAHNGTYVYAVHNYSESPLITTSQAKVEVYNQSGLIKTYNVPISGQGLWWHVFDMDGFTGDIIDVNTVVDSVAPY